MTSEQPTYEYALVRVRDGQQVSGASIHREYIEGIRGRRHDEYVARRTVVVGPWEKVEL